MKEWFLREEEEEDKVGNEVKTISKQHSIICLRHFLFNFIQWISSRPYQIWTYLYHVSIINWEQFCSYVTCFYLLPCLHESLNVGAIS